MKRNIEQLPSLSHIHSVLLVPDFLPLKSVAKLPLISIGTGLGSERGKILQEKKSSGSVIKDYLHMHKSCVGNLNLVIS